MSNSQQHDDRLGRVRMTLFVAGDEANSRWAKANLARVCREDLEGNYELKVVDVLEDFHAAMEHNVMVTPTLIVSEPPPGVTILGDLRDTERLRAALGLEPVGAEVNRVFGCDFSARCAHVVPSQHGRMQNEE